MPAQVRREGPQTVPVNYGLGGMGLTALITALFGRISSTAVGISGSGKANRRVGAVHAGGAKGRLTACLHPFRFLQARAASCGEGWRAISNGTMNAASRRCATVGHGC